MVSKHRDPGVVDMHQMAPTAAEVLGVKLPAAKNNRVLTESRTAGRHYNTIHKEWIAIAKRELS